jgi:hypothetical protein
VVRSVPVRPNALPYLACPQRPGRIVSRDRVGVSVDDLPAAVFAPEGGRRSQLERPDLLAVADPGLPMLDLEYRAFNAPGLPRESSSSARWQRAITSSRSIAD